MLGRVRALAGRLKVPNGGRKSLQAGIGEAQLKENDNRIQALKGKVERQERELEDLRAKMDSGVSEVGGLKPENVVWILGCNRDRTAHTQKTSRTRCRGSSDDRDQRIPYLEQRARDSVER